MLPLSRDVPTMWMIPSDAVKMKVLDNDWVKTVNASGIYVCRVIVSQRMPNGVVFVYHVQESTIDTPRTETNNERCGNNKALTGVRIKPSHLAGGCSRHAFGFNVLGPDGQPGW